MTLLRPRLKLTESRNVRQREDGSKIVKLRFLGKDSTPTNSPTLYATDHGVYIVQGWIVADSEILAKLDIPEDETVVEVPPQLLTHLAKDGLEGVVTSWGPPIVHVKEGGNYIIQGKRVDAAETLGQMDIPDHEDCVEVAKSAMESLLNEG
ncbi:hypothetical protein [Streptosporangium subroseum]|uniref:hypothetical protein n=1 Tax=Streptosporangium subroseum TaxID=106412 RepID=UPI0030899D84|nr:hypothetical protein OHB15_45565 [Streptosporangium subroseum]